MGAVADITEIANPVADVAEIISAFKKHDVVAEIKACSTLVEAIEALASIFFPAIAVAEIPTGALAALAVLGADYSEGQFSIDSLFLGTLADNAGERQGEIIAERFNH